MGGSCGRIGMTGAGSTSSTGSARRARVCARRTACPERRTSAPAEAPESSSAPTTSARTPTIVVPVVPTSVPNSRSNPRPSAPPCASPSVASRPKLVTTSPVRNGLTSTSALRAIINAPTVQNRPSATNPSPISSRCCWLFGLPFPLRVRFLTREGRRGLSVRFLRRRALPATLPLGGRLLPAGGRNDVHAGGEGPEAVRESLVVGGDGGAAAKKRCRAASDPLAGDLRLHSRLGGVHRDHVERAVQRPRRDPDRVRIGPCRRLSGEQGRREF